MDDDKKVPIRNIRQYLDFEHQINDIFIDFITTMRQRGLSLSKISQICFGQRLSWLIIFDRRSKSFNSNIKNYKVSVAQKIRALICAGYQFDVFVKKPYDLVKPYPNTKSAKLSNPSDDTNDV